MTDKQWKPVCLVLASGSILWGISLLDTSWRHFGASFLLMFGGMWLEDFRQRTTSNTK